jgi:hypothetical protein
MDLAQIHHHLSQTQEEHENDNGTAPTTAVQNLGLFGDDWLMAWGIITQ